MKYYEFINKVIGQDSLYKARNIPYYYIDYDYSKEQDKAYTHNFFVDSSTRSGNYRVIIKNNGEEYISAKCTCLQYKNASTCKHIAACLMHFHREMESYKVIDIYKESKDILNLFYEDSTNLNVKEKLNLELQLSFYQNNTVFKLLIGSKKLYVLNNKSKFTNFMNAYTNGGCYEFGTKLTYNKNLHYFDDEDKKVLDYLSSYELNDYSPFAINENDLNFFLNNLSLSKIKINETQLKNIYYELPSNLVLEEKENNDYELRLEDVDKYTALTTNFKYIYSNNNLYILPEFEQKLILEFARRGITSLIFTKKEIETFSKGVLKKLKKNINISENIKDIKINIKPEEKIYLDISSNLTCKVLLKYDSKEFNIFDNIEVIRDYAYEEEILKDLITSGFNIEKNKIKIEDIDTIGYFLEEKLSFLGSKYNVYTSKKLDNTTLIKKSRISKDFSIGTSGIMSFNFSIDNINEDELKSIFSSLEQKKTYHKLKNGNLVNLESDEELKNLNSLFKDLDIFNISNTIEIPKYRALYIDSLRENKYKDITTNNLFEEFINNFKEYKNVNFKFNKEDNSILRDYQKIGVKWLYTLYKCDLGGILADEMGLGKSIQTICFLKQVIKEKKDAKILIVCPTSLVYNWEKEFEKFGSNLKYKAISDTKQKRIEEINKNDINIYITSYGLLRNDIDIYKENEYDLCIIDEAQYIKNYQAKMTLCLKMVKARTKLALTGTPLENSVTELWSIFDFLMPGYLNSVKKFHDKYRISDIKKEDLEKLESLNYQIKPFILRRKKADVTTDLPDKLENNIYLELPDTQKKLYLSVLKETEREINELIETEGYKSAQFKILSLLTKLRQICINPLVCYENYEGEAIKIEKVIEMIKDYAKENHKILIFSSFKRILDLLKTKLDTEHISYYSIDGGVKGKERVPLVDKFNNDDTTCFLITLKSGGTGLNLTSADIVIHLDIWWNPQAENQATDRAHRIGQTKNVIVNKLITKGTIEERILELQTKKRVLSDNLIEGHTSGEVLSSLTEEEIKSLLSYDQD